MTHQHGSLIIDVQDKTLSAEEKEIINHPLIGGIILFARNYESREQLTHLCRQIRAARPTPLLIMVDQEGGRVQRFTHEFTRLPHMAEFGKLHDKDPGLATRMAKDCGWLMAMELLSAGIDLSLAPVLDLNKGVSSIIGERAFHSRPQDVVTLAKAYMSGMHEAGMPSTGKHFPGHGSVQLDSHIANPIDERSMEEIERDDMLPFAGMIEAGISAMMAAHIVFPRADALPVGYSRYWLQDVLRQRLGFKGAILSDDLSMEGANISCHYSDRVIAAREAGCDIALLCNNRQAVTEVLDRLPYQTQMVERDKWGVLQADFSSVSKQAYQENPRYKQIRNDLNRLGSHDDGKHQKN